MPVASAAGQCEASGSSGEQIAVRGTFLALGGTPGPEYDAKPASAIRRSMLGLAMHVLFSPWLLVAFGILAWIKFRPHRSHR